MRLFDCFMMDLRSPQMKLSVWTLLRRYLLSIDYRVIVRYRIAMWMRSKKALGKAGRVAANSLLRQLSTSPGVEINCRQPIGEGLEIRHAHDIVIGAGAIVGKNLTVYNGVTLGARRLKDLDDDGSGDQDRYPTVEDDVTIFSGAKVLGPVTIGKGSTIGANAVVLDSFPPKSVIAGVPARLIRSVDPCR